MKCIYCNTEQIDKAFFCPNCFKQTKCRHCGETLLKDAKICIYCGTEIGKESAEKSVNTIEFSETQTGRTFKASFTDSVGQSISDSFGLFIANKINLKNQLPSGKQQKSKPINEQDTVVVEGKHHEEPEEIDIIEINNDDTPTLNDVKLRDLAKNETDWLLVYMYFASEKGTKEFTRENIIQLYKDSGRRTDNRIKSLSQYFKRVAQALYIKSTNETNFILLDKGKKKVLEIFKGNSVASPKQSKPIKKGSSNNGKSVNKSNPKTTTKAIRFIDLKLTLPEQESLNNFYDSKKPTTQNEKVIVAMKWFLNNNDSEEVAIEEMNYLLSIASKTPPALKQVLGNMVGSKFRWVTKGSKGKYQLSSIAENHIANNLPKKSK